MPGRWLPHDPSRRVRRRPDDERRPCLSESEGGGVLWWVGRHATRVLFHLLSIGGVAMRAMILFSLLTAILYSAPAEADQPSPDRSHRVGQAGLGMVGVGIGLAGAGSLVAGNGLSESDLDKATGGLLLVVGGGAAFAIGTPIAVLGAAVTAQRLNDSGEETSKTGAWVGLTGLTLVATSPVLKSASPQDSGRGTGAILGLGFGGAVVGAVVQSQENLRVGEAADLIHRRRDRPALSLIPSGRGLVLVGSF